MSIRDAVRVNLGFIFFTIDKLNGVWEIGCAFGFRPFEGWHLP